MTCRHEDFAAFVDVARVVADGADESDPSTPVLYFSVETHIQCVECGAALLFLGMPAGSSPYRPMVSLDQKEARLAAWIEGPPQPAHESPGFHVRVQASGDPHDN